MATKSVRPSAISAPRERPGRRARAGAQGRLAWLHVAESPCCGGWGADRSRHCGAPGGMQ